MAGKVPPMAVVAGSNNSRGKKNATAQWWIGDGVEVNRLKAKGMIRGVDHDTTNAHMPIMISNAAYQRPGWEDRLIGRSKAQAPSANPQKNAEITDITLIISWPNMVERVRVQTIS